MNKASRFLHFALEIIWFAAGLFCTFIAIREGIALHLKQSGIFLTLTLIALYFFFSRRKQRMK
jgi:hypothetical protein